MLASVRFRPLHIINATVPSVKMMTMYVCLVLNDKYVVVFESRISRCAIAFFSIKKPTLLKKSVLKTIYKITV